MGALIRGGEREVEQCFETIGQIECCHDAVRAVELLSILNLVQNVVSIFILLVLVGAHIVGMTLVEEVRAIVVEGRKRARGAISIAQEIDFARELRFLLHIGIEANIRLNHLRDARLHVERSCVAVVVVVKLHALFAVVAQRRVISGCFTTTRECHGVVMVESVVGEQLKPVGIHRFCALHFSQKAIVVRLSSNKTMVCTFITHHGHVVGEGVVEVHQFL